MSIDEMIEVIESGLDPNRDEARRIIAALRAGQAMRNRINDGRLLDCAAWDAVVTEEDIPGLRSRELWQKRFESNGKEKKK